MKELENDIIVSTRGLTKIYGQTAALKDADITIRHGDIYGLVGNNGAGKTTLLKMLAGIVTPTKGSFTLLSAGNESEYRRARRRTGAIIETPGFFPKMTVRQNLEYYRIQRGIPGKGVVDKALKEVNLSYAAGKKFDALSLGMKQRLGLALALMGEPEVLILDEPINGLDPTGIIEIRNLLLKLNQEKGVTILISSHILTELENIATKYGFLNKGEVVEQIDAETLKEKCRSYLEVCVTDAAKYAALLEKELGCINYKILPDNCVHILETAEQITDYSALAVKHGIGLLSFSMKEIKLENYYMNLIGEAEKKAADSRERV